MVLQPCARAQYIITTVAGNGAYDFTWSEGLATGVGLNDPYDVFCDRAGNYFIVHPHAVRMVDTTGMLHNIAGGVGAGVAGYAGDGGPATAALLNNPQGITGDTAGNIYIADSYNFVIRKVNVAGIISTIAGNHISGYSGDGGPATAASMGSPRGMAIDRWGNLYFADGGNYCVRKINTSGIITTVAGTGVAGFSGDGGPAAAAQVRGVDVVADTLGNLFIADGGNNRIRKVDAAGIITTIAGSTSPGFSGDGGPATLAKIRPAGIAVDRAGNLYIADNTNNRVRMVNTSGIITTIAGNGIAGFSDNACSATAAQLKWDRELSLDAHENIYVVDAGNLRIRKLTPNFVPVFTAGAVQTLALCKDASAYTINTWLSVDDTDIGQSLAWTVITPPAHGTYSGTYSATVAGGIVVPGGLYYAPAAGYVGADTFRLVVTDCAGAKDTVSIYIYVYDPPIGAGVIAGTDTLCQGNTALLSATVPGGTWMATNPKATVASGTVTGVLAGIDTIMYIVNNACIADTATHVIHIKDCMARITEPGAHVPALILQVWPNPNDGTFNIRVSAEDGLMAGIIITNLVGEKMKEMEVKANKNAIVHLNIPDGVYFVSAETGGSTCSRRVVIIQ